VYEVYKAQAKKQDRTASELIREAMERYRQSWTGNETSLLDLPPIFLGKPLKPLSPDDDLLDEMLYGDRD
jgi:hypothetical protein